MKLLFKYLYILLGIGLFILINILSYTNGYVESLTYKLTFSIISFILLIIDIFLIINPKDLIKDDFRKKIIFALYLGILIIPLISITK